MNYEILIVFAKKIPHTEFKLISLVFHIFLLYGLMFLTDWIEMYVYRELILLQTILQKTSIFLNDFSPIASHVTIEVELYRDLPGGSRRTFISAHKSNEPSLSKLHTINFPPRLISHVLIRLYHAQNYNKTLRVNTLRLLGRHANDNRLLFTETCENNCTNANNLGVENSLNKIR